MAAASKSMGWIVLVSPSHDLLVLSSASISTDMIKYNPNARGTFVLMNSLASSMGHLLMAENSARTMMDIAIMDNMVVLMVFILNLSHSFLFLIRYPFDICLHSLDVVLNTWSIILPS